MRRTPALDLVGINGPPASKPTVPRSPIPTRWRRRFVSIAESVPRFENVPVCLPADPEYGARHEDFHAVARKFGRAPVHGDLPNERHPAGTDGSRAISRSSTGATALGEPWVRTTCASGTCAGSRTGLRSSERTTSRRATSPTRRSASGPPARVPARCSRSSTINTSPTRRCRSRGTPRWTRTLELRAGLEERPQRRLRHLRRLRPPRRQEPRDGARRRRACADRRGAPHPRGRRGTRSPHHREQPVRPGRGGDAAVAAVAAGAPAAVTRTNARPERPAVIPGVTPRAGRARSGCRIATRSRFRAVPAARTRRTARTPPSRTRRSASPARTRARRR